MKTRHIIVTLHSMIMFAIVTLIYSELCNAGTFDASNWFKRMAILEGPDMRPSRPLSLPAGFSGSGESDVQTIPLSYDLFLDVLPQIPKLQLGYLYTFGKDLRWGRMTGDFFAPVGLSPTSTVFGQVHVEFQDYWKIPFAEAHHRVDFSAGGGYRTLASRNLMLGANVFYDSTRIYNEWFASAGAGAEAAVQLPSSDVIDFSYNYYGNLSRGNRQIDGTLVNGPPNMDFELGYSHAVLGNTPDLRARINAYNYDTTQSKWGFKGGADLATLNGALTLRAEIGSDQLYGSYQTVGAFVNIPIKLDNILGFKSPLVLTAGTPNGHPQGVGSAMPDFGAGPAANGGSRGPTIPQKGAVPGCYPYGPAPITCNPDVIPAPLYACTNNLVRFLNEPVRRQYASHAVSITGSDSNPAAPKILMAEGIAYILFDLYPKYTTSLLNNIKPAAISLSATVTSRGSSNVSGIQLNIKEGQTVVWVVNMPEWSTSMGLTYKYDLTPNEINQVWQALNESPERSIYEVRFTQATGMNLTGLEIVLVITQ